MWSAASPEWLLHSWCDFPTNPGRFQAISPGIPGQISPDNQDTIPDADPGRRSRTPIPDTDITADRTTSQNQGVTLSDSADPGSPAQSRHADEPSGARSILDSGTLRRIGSHRAYPLAVSLEASRDCSVHRSRKAPENNPVGANRALRFGQCSCLFPSRSPG